MWRRTLESLLESGGLPLTAIPLSIRKDLEQWGVRTGTLELVQQGRGARLQVVNESLLRIHVQKEFPTAAFDVLEEEMGRVRNLAFVRDTKAGETRLSIQYLLGKTLGANPIVIETESKQVDLTSLSTPLGCIALPLSLDFPSWSGDMAVLLVENQALFDHLSWLPSGWSGILFHYAGNLSDLHLEWFSRLSFPSVTIFPDYDGMGLRNFYRLRSVLPITRWHWEPDWEDAMERYGNADLWKKERQRTEFDSLWKRWEQDGWPDPALRPLMEEMRRKGRMLEQEWVLTRRR